MGFRGKHDTFPDFIVDEVARGGHREDAIINTISPMDNAENIG